MAAHGQDVQTAAGDEVVHFFPRERRIAGVPFRGHGAVAVQVHGDDDEVFHFAVGADDHHGVGRTGVDAADEGAVEKCRMQGEDRVEAGDVVDLVRSRAPVQRAVLVHVDFFLREPFHAVREPERAAGGRQRAQRRAEHRVAFAGCGQTVVVVGLGVMDHEAVRVGFVPGVVQVAFDLVAGIILEEFGIRPVHVRAVEQRLRDFRRAAEAFQQEDRIREFTADGGNDVFPCSFRDHVSGIAAESVDAAAAPGQEDVRQVAPQGRVLVVEFDQVAPGDAPRAGRNIGAVVLPHEPVGMLLLELRRPARVVDGDVEEDAGVLAVDRVDQLEELFQR